MVDGGGGDGAPAGNVSALMTFFMSSRGSGRGGDLGGLVGADAHCKALATAVSPQLGAKSWRAYLSTSTVNARSRIGAGPWLNARGVMVARTVDELHDQQDLTGALSSTWPVGASAFDVILDERGQIHPAAVHDVLTGSTMAGMVDGANHCGDWTSQTGMSVVGHTNREGGGRPPSWNAAHTAGCGSELDAQGNLVNRVQGTVTSGGGRGSIYCFVPN
jgi:hypothetical protein